ncbi:MAG: helix-turn-helix domain-containing protein [Bacteroidia bacterium]
MKDEIFRVTSISQLCEIAGLSKPTHPLIHIVDVATWAIGPEQIGLRYSTDLYTIGLKDKHCGFMYGRRSYDFDEGVMMFVGPHQVSSLTQTQQPGEVQGWMLFFHPDLIRPTHLGTTIDKYSFFSYDVHEALHLSDQEQQTVTDIVQRMQDEVQGRIDHHSNSVIVSGLELLLNYSLRFYERQFNTRKAVNSDIVTQVDALLRQYYEAGRLAEAGAPGIQYLADSVHLSPHYLSDLLKKESGMSAKDYVNDFIVGKAKTLLRATDDSVSEIAYALGFNYPHYFSRLFRSRTGMTPKAYRTMN